VHHRHFHFPDDREVVLDQQIVVAVNAATNRIFYRQHAVTGWPMFDRRKHVLEALARHERGVRAHQP
jgi:hypothetical protein